MRTGGQINCNRTTTKNLRQGQAALIAAVFFLVISTSVIFGLARPVLKQIKISSDLFKSKQSFFLAEAGLEDAVYRLSSGYQVSSETMSFGEWNASVVIQDIFNRKIVTVEGDLDSRIRTVKSELVQSEGVAFHYGVQVGDGGLKMGNNSRVIGNVYSNGSIIGNNGATITGTAVVAGGLNPAPSVEWSQHNADFAFATVSANRDVAQSFTATAGERINRLSVYLAKVGSPSGSITVRLAADNSNKPSTSSLASVTINPAMVGATPGWIDVAFASPPLLANGAKYWIVLDTSSYSASHYWIWRRDSSDAYAGNTGKYTSNCCSGSPVWSDVGGDLAFLVWLGGTNTRIQNVIIGDSQSGLGRSNLFVNTTIHGSACPNQYCVVDNPPRQELPIPEGVIQDWREQAAAGGVIQGDYNVTSNVSLGPKEITGNLNLTSNNKTLTITGTIYVRGNISVSNGSAMRCDASYGVNSCVVLSDGWVHTENNGVFAGSGTNGSFLLLLTTSPCDGSFSSGCTHHNAAVDIHNNFTGAIIYASRGMINLHNGVNVTELVAHKVELGNDVVITYNQGLANISFSSGPSGGWQAVSWREI